MRVLCFDIVFIGSRSSEWKAIARKGTMYKIQAIKAYKDSFPENHRPGLHESKEKIEAYMGKHHII